MNGTAQDQTQAEPQHDAEVPSNPIIRLSQEELRQPSTRQPKPRQARPTTQKPQQAPQVEAALSEAAPAVKTAREADVTTISPFLSLEEAAAYARSCKRQVQRWLEVGLLTRCGYGRRTLVLKEELHALLLSGKRVDSKQLEEAA